MGERDGPGVPYIAPERFGILAGCCNALSRGHSHTHADQGQRPGADGDDQGCPITRIPWLPGPPATGAGSSKKSLWNQKWGGRSPCKGGGGPIPAPRRRPLRPVAWRHNPLMRSGRPFCRARNGASPLNPPRRRHPLRTGSVDILCRPPPPAPQRYSGHRYFVLSAPCSVHRTVLCGPIGGVLFGLLFERAAATGSPGTGFPVCFQLPRDGMGSAKRPLASQHHLQQMMGARGRFVVGSRIDPGEERTGKYLMVAPQANIISCSNAVGVRLK